jgi:hypothetical protein
MATTKKKTRSWGWVIFWFILFWPVGLILLFKKINSDKATMFKDGNKVTIMSFVLMGLGALIFMAILGGSADTYTFLWAFALIGGGVWVFFVGRKMKADGERYKKYIALVANQNQTSIDNIAPAVGVSYEVAAKDLQKMIDLDYFHGAYIDMAQREIVLAKTAPHQVAQMASTTQAQVQEKIATCGSCGANNRVTVGQIAECEYCGSPLQ